MGEKRKIVCRYVGKGLSVYVATSIAGIKRSTYYYRPNGRPKGRGPSTHAQNLSSGLVPNEVVVNDIIELITPDFHDYGYQTLTPLLKQKGLRNQPQESKKTNERQPSFTSTKAKGSCCGETLHQAHRSTA